MTIDLQKTSTIEGAVQEHQKTLVSNIRPAAAWILLVFLQCPSFLLVFNVGNLQVFGGWIELIVIPPSFLSHLNVNFSSDCLSKNHWSWREK